MAACISPWKHPQLGVILPCGKCYECRARHVSGWSYRLMKEAERSSSAFFVTFTYDNDHVPLTKNGLMTLQKKDLQLFFKRLRHEQKTKIKYYACGEYGGTYGRPHYHIILFNVELANLIGRRAATHYRLGYIQLDGKVQYRCPTWEHGHITVGHLSEASAGYTLKYISKPATVPKHARDDRNKEFALMSKKLGDNYISHRTIRWHNSNSVDNFYLPLKDGKKVSLPRYYKQKLYTESRRKYIGFQVRKKALEALTFVDPSTGEVLLTETVEKMWENSNKQNLIIIEKIRKSQRDSRYRTIK